MNKIKTIILITALSISLVGIASSLPGDQMVEVNVIFDYQIDNAFLNDISAKINQRFESFQGVSISIPKAMIPVLDRMPFIKTWEYNNEVHLLQDSIDWGVDRVNAEVVWGGAENAVDVTGTCGAGVKLAVIDTGIDMNHPDLNVAGGYDYVNNDNNPDDDHGHGTHVAGTIAALDNGAGLVGVAPCVQIYAVKVLSASGSGTDAQVAAGIEWAGDNGMDIASMSLGSSSPSSTIQAAGQYAASQGVLLIAASGNDGANSVGYPAAFSEFMAVGASDSSDNIASFSNRGSAMEITAPGVSIYSTYRGGGYATLSGTSMATPHVSGVAALVKSSDSSLSASDIRSRLQSTADDVGSSGWDSTYGYGIVNAEAAVSGSGGGGGGGDTDGGALQNGVTVTDQLVSSSDTDTWTLDVASNAASMHVVLDSGSNDFDFFASHTTSNPTHSNNEFEGYTGGGEDVTFNNPGAGTWYIVVDQYSGTGAYSLTVTVTYGGGGGGDTNGGTLENGVTVTDQLTSSSDSDIWNIDVASGATSIQVVLDSGSNDFDFFASHLTSNPTHSNNEFEGYTGGGEDVTFNNPGAGTWYIVVDQYSGTGAYSLTVTVTYGGGGGGGDTIELSFYAYDWDISGEVNVVVNGYELNWEAQGLTADAGYKTYTFDITSIAGTSLSINLVDTYGSYTNYFRDLIVYRNGVAESNLQSSWLETPGGSGVSYTYNL